MVDQVFGLAACVDCLLQRIKYQVGFERRGNVPATNVPREDMNRPFNKGFVL